MHRRQFVSSTLATAALAASRQAKAQAAGPVSRDYYQLRRYMLQNGPQTRLTESYFAEALIPALTRMGMGPIGAFRLDIGPETPTLYLLIPGSSLEALTTLDLHLAKDEAFLKTAAPFWSAPATTPAFLRVESSLLSAFEGWPRLTTPAKEKRILQLRTYESPSYAAHVRKVEMFNNGEFAIFTSAGFHNVFFGDTLVGPRMPNLTYMLCAPDMTQLNAHWQTFINDPAWKKLSTSPRYAYEEIVSNITSLILSPLDCSQV